MHVLTTNQSFQAVRLPGAILFCLLLAAGVARAAVDGGESTATSAAGILFSCPAGDGETLGRWGLTISATLLSYMDVPQANVPSSDMWLVGCNAGLRLCSTASPFQPNATDNNGHIVLDGILSVSGCDNSGLHLVVQGAQLFSCVPIQVRTPDLKSSGAPGPAPCGGDQICPDGRVNLADYSFFVTHYPISSNPAPPYFACADLALPYENPIGLADFSRFANHFAAGHACP